MAYRDPYTEQTGHQPQYNDDYNPYAPQHHQPYDQAPAGGYDSYGAGQAGYRDDPYAQSVNDSTAPYRQPPQGAGVARTATIRSFLTNNNADTSPAAARKETGQFENAYVSNTPSTREKPYAIEPGREKMWTRGSKPRCIGRFFCCTLMTAVFLFLSIVLTLVLFIRPPAITISDVDTSNLSFNTVDDGLTISGLSINVTVNNPNYFDVNFPKVVADLFFDDVDIGGGTSSDVNFPSGTEKSWQFPFDIEYTTKLDPKGTVLADLLSKCGITGGDKQNLDITYKIKPTVKILFVSITPAVSGTFSFECPLDASNLGGLIGGGS